MTPIVLLQLCRGEEALPAISFCTEKSFFRRMAPQSRDHIDISMSEQEHGKEDTGRDKTQGKGRDEAVTSRGSPYKTTIDDLCK